MKMAQPLSQMGRRERAWLAMALVCALAWWGGQGAGRVHSRSHGRRVRIDLERLQRDFDAQRAARFAAQLLKQDRGMDLELGGVLLRLARVQASRGDAPGALRTLEQLRLRAAGTALAAEAALASAHVQRRDRGVSYAHDRYRLARDDPHALSEDRDEAHAWWIRGLCAMGRHGQARDEWRTLQNNASTERWRRHAQAWLHRCSRVHESS